MKRLAVVALVACGSSRAPAQQPQHSVPMDSAERARAYELGHGVTRDYRKAAELYNEGCRDGCGSLTACKPYFALVSKNRGVVLGDEKTSALAGRLCDRGMKKACFVAVMFGIRDPSRSPGDDAMFAKACDAGDAESCELVGGIAFKQHGEDDERAQRARERACELGVMEQCAKRLSLACKGEASAMACVEHAELSALHEQDGERKKLRESEAQSLRTTLMRVDAACSEGDADACEAIPEHEVDRHARCRAGDYDVCAQLGDLGDFEAAEAACGAGLTGKCHDYDATSNIKAFQARIAMRDACVRGDRNACAQMQKLTAPPCPK